MESLSLTNLFKTVYFCSNKEEVSYLFVALKNKFPIVSIL